MKYLRTIALLTLLFSCRNGAENKDATEEIRTGFYTDVPFEQEYHEGFVIDAQEPGANDVRAIQPDSQENIWIATKQGVYMKKLDAWVWTLMITSLDQGPAYDVETDENGAVWIAAWDGAYTNRSGRLEKVEGPEPPLARVVIANEGVYALGPHGIWLHRNNAWEKKDYPAPRSVRAALSDGNGGLWIGSDVGLFHCNDKKTEWMHDTSELISAYIQGRGPRRNHNPERRGKSGCETSGRRDTQRICQVGKEIA